MELKLEECLAQINKDREKIEAPFVFCLWKDPDLYDDYKKINVNGDDTIQSEDSLFYFNLGRTLYNSGFRTFDNVTIATFLEDKKTMKSVFQELGSYGTVKEMMELVDTDNVEAYYDKIAKLNVLSNLCKMNFKMFGNMDQFKNMSSQNIYDLFEYQLNNVSLSVEQNVKVEDLTITDDFLDRCNAGENMGLDYSENCPILSHRTAGLCVPGLFLLGGYSGVGKSSFLFSNMIMPLCRNGIKVMIASNEMEIDSYRSLLLVEILTHDMDYWKLTRKKLKNGHFTEEEFSMLKNAQRIQKEKYSNVQFVKVFDNDIDKIIKIATRASKTGLQCLIVDTFKSSDDATVDGSMWQHLLLDSRKLLQCSSKCNINITISYQLAIHTENIRYTSSSCLSNAKQIKETMSEQVFLRKIWDDERDPKNKFYCHPYRLKKTSTGKYMKVDFELNQDKKYLIAFIDKTRNDEDGIQLIYSWNGRFNKWIEEGYCTIINTHN